VLLSGTIQNDGPNGLLPSGYVSPELDPQDAEALTLFAAQGPCSSRLLRPQWSNQPWSAPATYWKAIGNGQWQLTGLGARLAPQTAGLLPVGWSP
jgi:hypothetical protein